MIQKKLRRIKLAINDTVSNFNLISSFKHDSAMEKGIQRFVRRYKTNKSDAVRFAVKELLIRENLLAFTLGLGMFAMQFLVIVQYFNQLQ